MATAPSAGGQRTHPPVVTKIGPRVACLTRDGQFRQSAAPSPVLDCLARRGICWRTALANSSAGREFCHALRTNSRFPYRDHLGLGNSCSWHITDTPWSRSENRNRCEVSTASRTQSDDTARQSGLRQLQSVDLTSARESIPPNYRGMHDRRAHYVARHTGCGSPFLGGAVRFRTCLIRVSFFRALILRRQVETRRSGFVAGNGWEAGPAPATEPFGIPHNGGVW